MARKLPRLNRALDAPALASVAYGEIASSIYFALGIVALHALGLAPWVLLVMGALFLVVALSYANLLEGSVLTETVFAWPGLGMYITSSLLNADMNAVLGGTLVVGSVFIALNLLSDLAYRFIDPRVR